MRWLRKLPVDAYVAAMLATVVAALLVPVRGGLASAASVATDVAIGLLFFLYGARITPSAARAGAAHWRLHLVVLLCTFGLFPLLGLATSPLTSGLLGTQLYHGVIFLCFVPSTVQSAIALTSMARGNVPAAIFSASFSSIIGIALTPLFVLVFMRGFTGGGITAGSVVSIVIQLLLPFAAGQLLRPWLGDWLKRHKGLLSVIDRGSVLLVIYTAVSAGVVAGVWRQVTAGRLGALILVLAALLAVVLGSTSAVASGLRFTLPDRTAAIFCGSTKSVAAGLPMAAALFDTRTAGLIVLPLILYHQFQLIVCTILARRMANTPPPAIE